MSQDTESLVSVVDLLPGKVDVEGLTSAQARARALKLVATLATTNAELMQLLHRVMSRREYEAWGFETMRAWVDGELKFSYRKALNFLQIWDNLHVKAGVPVEDLNDVEWTKLRVIASAVEVKAVTTQDQVQRLLETARKTQRDVFVNKTREMMKAGGTEDPNRISRVILELNQEQQRLWDQVVGLIRRQLGHSESPGGIEISKTVCFEKMMLSIITQLGSFDDEAALYLNALARTHPRHEFLMVHKKYAPLVQDVIKEVAAQYDEVPHDLGAAEAQKVVA